MAGYIFEGYCYPTIAALSEGHQAKIGEVVGRFIIVDVLTSDFGGGVALAEIQMEDPDMPGSLWTVSILSDEPCTQWGPVPDPFHLTPVMAGTMASLTVVLFAAAFAARSLRRVK